MIKSYVLNLSHNDWSLRTHGIGEDKLKVVMSRRIPYNGKENVIGEIYAESDFLLKEIIKTMKRSRRVNEVNLIDIVKTKNDVRATIHVNVDLKGGIAEKLVSAGAIYYSESIYDGFEKWLILINSSNLLKVLPEIKEECYNFKLTEQDVPFLSAKHKLTKRERDIIEMSLMKGYFDYPKKVKLEEISEELGVSKVAVLQTLRRAIKKVIKSNEDILTGKL